jgi:type II secretory pathway pseudopilin PulG
MAIVVVIMSILIGSVYALVPVQTDVQNVDLTKAKLDRIQGAINAYVNQNGFLPCPADSTAAVATATFGTSTDCSTGSAPTGTTESGTGDDTIRQGVVPSRTLNLADTDMFDAWNNRFTYVVIKKLATTITNFSTAAPTNAAIIMQDVNNNQINNAPVAYVLISHGKHSDGAVNYNGVTTTCTAGTPEAQNCSNTSTFKDGVYNTNSTNYFDDYVRWKTKSQQIHDSSYTSGALTSSVFSKFALIADQEAPGTSGQTPIVINSWNTRNLNTVVFSTTPAPITTLNAGNTITMPAGNYYIRATAPAQGVTGHRLRIYNVTAGTTIAEGMSVTGDVNGTSTANTTAVSLATVIAYVSFSAATDIRIDHYVNNFNTTINGGAQTGFEFGYPVTTTANETYTTVEIFGQ